MSEAWVLIAIAPVLYLLSTGGHQGVRLLMLAFVFLVVGDGLLSAVLIRSIRVSSQLPTVADVDTDIELPIAVTWPIGGPVIAHFTEGFTSEKAGGPTDLQGHLTARAVRRGPVGEVTVTIAAGAFLGLIGFVVDSTLTPAEPVLALPPAIRDPEIASYLDSISTATEPELIGVRPYRPGDRPADMHWPSVARTDELMVRERVVMPFEPPPLTIVATDTSAARIDRTLGLARFAAEQAWRSGVPVTLVTHEDASTEAPVSTNRFEIPYLPPTRRSTPVLTIHELRAPADLHRALALAIPGPQPSAPFEGAHLIIADLDRTMS